ncbi:hypothetical protein MKW98_032125 [Papaver atlanticum]|uniref:RING-type domain-containing protein n=1 Tax=Papaver atlanticum TaxID=357466 RepID=A0AAD4SEI2_9MAGN|nr:hypothetical protein MKW98_032125 [Papaver atlanticum]
MMELYWVAAEVNCAGKRSEHSVVDQKAKKTSLGFAETRGCSALRVLAATVAQRLQLDNEDSNGKTETETSKKDRLMPDLCIICLEQEYNAVFVPCGHMCCCTTCSSHLTSWPLCRRRIEQVIKTFCH